MRVSAAVWSAVLATVLGAAQGTSPQAPAAVAIDGDDIGGVVTGRNGPEVGVWGIAVTTDLPTKFARIVGTDDRGRYPYPLGYYTKWMDGRIDDAAAGWKGRGIWTTVSTRAPFHMEGGKGTTSKVVKFQLRPDPLAR